MKKRAIPKGWKAVIYPSGKGFALTPDYPDGVGGTSDSSYNTTNTNTHTNKNNNRR